MTYLLAALSARVPPSATARDAAVECESLARLGLGHIVAELDEDDEAAEQSPAEVRPAARRG